MRTRLVHRFFGLFQQLWIFYYFWYIAHLKETKKQNAIIKRQKYEIDNIFFKNQDRRTTDDYSSVLCCTVEKRFFIGIRYRGVKKYNEET